MDSLQKIHKEIMKKKLLLKRQQKWKIQSHIVFTEEISKLVLNSNDNKRMSSINLIETYQYGLRNFLISRKEEIKSNNVSKQYKND